MRPPETSIVPEKNNHVIFPQCRLPAHSQHELLNLLLFIPDPPLVLSASTLSPTLETRAAAHAWVLLSPNCALHYQIVVKGLDKNGVQLSGFAELGTYAELPDGGKEKQLVNGFVGNIVSNKFRFVILFQDNFHISFM
jgi:hypothetical protein